MPWEIIKLNSGYTIPSIGYGTWTLGNGQSPIDQVEQALEVGFTHIDTAQAYRNEEEAGKALYESGIARGDVYITTKYSGTNGLDIDTSIHNSVKNLGVSYVDLYLIHSPRLAVPDIPTAWAKMEKVQQDGFAKSVGISNFNVKDMETLLASAKIIPAVNQILLHPYVYEEQKPILEYAAKHGIVIEAYSSLIPLTKQPGGPLDAPVNEICNKLGATPEQVLLAWAKAKGAVVLTTSSKKTRLQAYLNAGDIVLTDDDIAAIDTAGALGARQLKARITVRIVSGAALVGAAILGACSYFGIHIM